MDAVERAWDALAPPGRQMAIVGGIALVAWEHLRATKDANILTFWWI